MKRQGICFLPALACCGLVISCEKEKSLPPADPGLAAKPVEESRPAMPPVLEIIRKAEKEELKAQVNHDKGSAIVGVGNRSGPIPDDASNFLTLKMEAYVRIGEYSDQLKAYQGTPFEVEQAAAYIRRSDLRRQVRGEVIRVKMAEAESDEAKVAAAKEQLALRTAELQKAVEEWEAVDRGGWRAAVDKP